jgi:PAS domain S-box-containing protein
MPINSHHNEILNSISEGLFTVDKEFKINFFNKSAVKITGYNTGEVTGKYCNNIFRSNQCKNNCPIVKVLQKGEEVNEMESVLHRKNGEQIIIRLNASVLRNGSGEPVGGVISFREKFSQESITEYLKKNSDFYGLIGSSKPMLDIYDLINEVSDCDASVLIQGETGTGKELIADAIKETGRRKDKPFIKVNCAVIPDNLLASELFGHVKGAFTDAMKDRTGRFEMADGGTIFLDEVAEMTPQTQLQLLRIIQNGTFERLGESLTRKIDVRVIAATNLNIEKAIAEGKFREDLYYRLNVIPVNVPPLREHKEDILLLTKHFLKKYSLLYNKQIIEIDDDALDVILSYNWPGNIRQLENAIEFAFIRTQSNKPICKCKLPPFLKENQFFPASNNNCKDEITDNDLIKTLERLHWNKSKAAEELGLNRTTIWRRLKAMGLEN